MFALNNLISIINIIKDQRIYLCLFAEETPFFKFFEFFSLKFTKKTRNFEITEKLNFPFAKIPI